MRYGGRVVCYPGVAGGRLCETSGDHARDAEGNHDLVVVGEAADGLEAVRMAEQLQPDLIVLDLNLPCLNGLEAARRIRKLSPGSRIVMASDECSDDVVQEAVRSGAQGYVKKSQIVHQLIPTIEGALNGKRLLLGMPDNP